MNSKYCTSCSVVLTKSYNKVIEYSSIEKQIKCIQEGDDAGEFLDDYVNNSINNSTAIAIDSSSSTNYKYTKEDIVNFFSSDNGQQEEHSLEESICKPLIGIQIYKPFFYYWNIDPTIENIHLKSIEDHIRLKDPERHKAKLLEIIQ